MSAASPAQRRWGELWGSSRAATRLEIALPRPYDEALLRRRWEELAPGQEIVWRLNAGRTALIVEASSAVLDAASAVLVAEALLGVRELGPERYGDVAAWWWETMAMRREDSVVRWDDYDALCACPVPLPWGTPSSAGELQVLVQQVPLDAVGEASIRSCAARLGVSVADLLCAAWLLFLARWTDSDSVLLAELFSGRALDELRDVVGPLERALPLRFEPRPSETFAETVRRVRAERTDAGEVQDYFLLPGNVPFSFVCREPRYAGPGRIAALTSLVEPFAMQLEVCVTDTSLAMTFGTDATLIAGREAESALAAWTTHLAAQVERRGFSPPGSGDEPRDPRRPEGTPLHQFPDDELTPRLEAAMNEHRHRPALLADGVSLDYAGLDRRSRELAERLTARGLRRGDRVAVAMPSSVDAVIAIVAVLRAGAAYVPLDPNGPAERLQYMLADSGARFLVRGNGVEVVDHAGVPPADEPPLAYIIYTSGSTGTPKGVAVPRRAVTALADALQSSVYARLEPHRRVALLASLSFDASVQQIFAALLGGHALLPVAADVKRDPAALCDLLSRHAVDVADGTPSLLELLVRHAPERLRSVPVRQWIIGGEPLTRDLLRRFFPAAAEGACIGNVYGLTECGVDSTLALLGPDDGVGTRSVPIGHPLPNAELLLLDAAGRPLPCGAVGEIAIGGPGLATGYLNDPVLTAQRFVPHPFTAGQRLFRTGDRGWIDADGAFHFVERRDEQVKVRGYRVDLGEVRAALLSCGGVEQAHVLLHDDGNGRPEIAAFVTTSRPVSRGALRDHLKKRLAEPMRPRILVQVDDWPLTTSGKLDRKALLERATMAEAAPAGDRLTGIFRRIVGDPYLAADDDFFDAGGNSLAALEAIAQIASELGAYVDVRTIYQARTAAELGRVLRSRQPASRRLVALRPAQPDAPDVFLLPPSLGVSHAFLPLAARLPEGLNVWGLDYRNAGQALEPSVEALAAALVEELPRHSAGRPVILAGYSAGALVAFEMVRLLERRGWRPGLIVIDTRMGGGQAILPVRDRAQDRQDYLSSTTTPLDVAAIATRYQPAHRIGADLVALEAAGNPVPARMESWRAWTSGRFHHAAVPGTHDTLLHPAHVGELARQLRLGLQFLEGGHPHAAIAGDATAAALRRPV